MFCCGLMGHLGCTVLAVDWRASVVLLRLCLAGSTLAVFFFIDLMLLAQVVVEVDAALQSDVYCAR